MTCPITADRDAFRGAVTDADTDRADALDNDFGFLMENERAILLEHLAAHRQQAEASFKAREDALIKAASDLRDDLLMRAQFDSDAVAIVAAGSGVWFRFNQALDAARAHTVAEGGE